MSVTDRDYYELLGVSRDAGEQEIKKAFRRLARELHPDVSKEEDAEARFREVTEAYEVLSNSETRELYDRYGHAGLRSGGFTPSHFDFGGLGDLFSAFFGDDVFGGGRGAGANMRGGDVATQVEIDIADAAAGVTLTVPVELAVSCSTCGGDGVAPGSSVRTCGPCRGRGQVQQVSRTIFGEIVRTAVCPECRGAGKVPDKMCESCGGEGRKVEERKLEVEIPPGIHDGQRIRLTGQGHAGARGGSPGDLYVSVSVRPDDRFVREGNDIVSQLDLTVVQAALGGKVSVETLDGPVELDLEPGVQPGTVRVLSGRGMPVLQGYGRGDHRVLVNVVVPKRLTAEQRELLERFEQLSDAGTYEDDEGLFDRLKSAFR